MKLSPQMRNKILDLLDGCYLSLHEGDPGVAGGNELAGAGYGRLKSPLAPARGANKTNLGPIQFADLPDSTVTHFGFWTAPEGGEFLLGAELATSIEAPTGSTIIFPPNTLTVSQA